MESEQRDEARFDLKKKSNVFREIAVNVAMRFAVVRKFRMMRSRTVSGDVSSQVSATVRQMSFLFDELKNRQIAGKSVAKTGPADAILSAGLHSDTRTSYAAQSIRDIKLHFSERSQCFSDNDLSISDAIFHLKKTMK